MKNERRVWLLFTSSEAKDEATEILEEYCGFFPKCGDGYSVPKSSLREIDEILSDAGFDLNKRYIQMY